MDEYSWFPSNIHFDRGSPFLSKELRDYFTNLRIVMSRKNI